MPTWKKLIVSGSDASLNSLTVASGLTGSLSGTASWATRALSASITQDNSTNATRFVVFSDSNTSGPQVLRNDNGLFFNPSTNTLTTTNFAGTATNANNVLIVDADTIAWGAGAVPLLFPAGAAASTPGSNQAVYGDTELTYNPSTNTLALANASTQSFGSSTLLTMGSNASIVAGRNATFRLGDPGATFDANVYITGSTNLYRSGSSIFTVSGSSGLIFSVSDEVSGNLFQIDSGSTSFFSVAADGITTISSSNLVFNGLPTASQNNVLAIDISNGLITYMATPAGGGSTVKAGSVADTSFAGNPRKATVTFTTPFSNNNYSISVTGETSRAWSIESKVSGSFVINSNSATAITGDTFWIATPFANP